MFKKRYNQNSFAYRLRVTMEKKQLRSCDLAEMSGVASCSISNYLNGRNEPTRRTARKLAASLGINVNWLLGIADIDDIRCDAEKNPDALVGVYRTLTDRNKTYLLETAFLLQKAQSGL